MPAPANVMNKIRAVQQQTKTLLVTVKTSEGAAASLNGASLTMTVRDEVGGNIIITKTTEGGGIEITCADDGQATVTLSTEDTDIPKGCYVYDLWVSYTQTTPPIRHPVVKNAELIIESAITDFTP